MGFGDISYFSLQLSQKFVRSSVVHPLVSPALVRLGYEGGFEGFDGRKAPLGVDGGEVTCS